MFDGFQDSNLEGREALECLCHAVVSTRQEADTWGVVPSVRVSRLPPPPLQKLEISIPRLSIQLVVFGASR